MSTSRASMAVTRIFRFGNSSAFRGPSRSHLNPTATANLIKSASEMQRPFETPSPNQQLFPFRNDADILFGNQIGPAAFPGADQSRLFARGDPVRIDDEFGEDGIDEFDSDGDEFDSDEDDTDFDAEDFDADEDDGEEDPGYKRRKSKV